MLIDTGEAREMLDRVRRIETRLTRYMNEQGFDIVGQQPMFHRDSGTLTVPSRRVTIEDCLRAIGSYDEPVDVYVGKDFVVTLDAVAPNKREYA